MKDLLTKINESQQKELKVKISLDDFNSDFSNVFSELMFEYLNRNKKIYDKITSEQIIKIINNFFEDDPYEGD